MHFRLFFALLIWPMIGLSLPAQEKTDGPPRKNPLLDALTKIKLAVVSIREADEPDETKRKTRGVGIIIDPDGTIVTSPGVIDKTNKLEIVLNDGRKLSAKALFSDAAWKLAVLKVEAVKPLPAIELANPNNIELGESIVTFGWLPTQRASAAMVSGKGRKTVKFENVYQIDSPISPGIPHGPVVSIEGKLIGIGAGNTPQNIQFVIPSESLKTRIADRAKAKSKS